MKRHHNHGAGARPSTPRRQERGYMLVFMILLVALVFVSFSAIIPKVRFEAQRDREEELYFRGMQYQHAIQLFFRKFGRYPNSIDELEKTNGIRFLRKRYSDPITMKKEWRLIHVGANGQFVDAKTTITAAPVVAGQPGGTTPSPSTTPGGQPGGSNSFSQPGIGAGQPTSQTPGLGMSPSPSSFGGSGLSPAGQPASTQPGAGIGNQPSNPALTPSANPSADPQQLRGTAGGQQTPGASNTLGGTTSNTPSSQSSSNPSPVFGGGAIAGVASLSEASSIRVIKTYDEYDKWEFIYDYRSDPVAMARTAGAQPQPQQGTPPGSAPPGTPNVTLPGMFPPGTPPGSTPPPNPFGLTPGANPPPRTR